MTTPEALQKHLQVCDELYQLAHEENAHLKQHRRAPASALLDRKRILLEQLDQSLTSLRTEKAGGDPSRDTRQLVEKVRARILQVLQLDKENEQLLLRVSLSRGVDSSAISAPSPAILKKIYDRTV